MDRKLLANFDSESVADDDRHASVHQNNLMYGFYDMMELTLTVVEVVANAFSNSLSNDVTDSLPHRQHWTTSQICISSDYIVF
jgi:hypothetical protein